MPRIARLISAIALLALPISALAHGAEELGHHWDVPAYRTEMHTQIALMVGACTVAIAGMLVRNALRRRRARQ
jgi:hypothetical protein